MIFHTYRLTIQSQKYNGNIPEKLAKRARRMVTHIKPSIFKPLDSSWFIAFPNSFKTACGRNRNQERTALWLFSQFMREQTKANLFYPIGLEGNSNLTKKKSGQPTMKLSTFYEEPMQLMMSLQKAKLTSWATNDLKFYVLFATQRPFRKQH